MYTGDYRAVALQHPADCCRSARALDGRRFLANNAPGLPLANCTSPGLCRCEYRLLTDRRDDFHPVPRAPARAGFRALAMRLFGSRRTNTI